MTNGRSLGIRASLSCTGTLSLAGVGRRGPRYSAAVDQAPPQRSAARAFPLHRPLIALGIRGPQGRRGQGRNRKPQPEAKRRDRVRISARSAALDRRSRAGGHRSPVLGGEWSVQPLRAVDYRHRPSHTTEASGARSGPQAAKAIGIEARRAETAVGWLGSRKPGPKGIALFPVRHPYRWSAIERSPNDDRAY